MLLSWKKEVRWQQSYTHISQLIHQWPCLVMANSNVYCVFVFVCACASLICIPYHGGCVWTSQLASVCMLVPVCVLCTHRLHSFAGVKDSAIQCCLRDATPQMFASSYSRYLFPNDSVWTWFYVVSQVDHEPVYPRTLNMHCGEANTDLIFAGSQWCIIFKLWCYLKK